MNAKYDSNNVFARILRGELSCFKVYEDNLTIAFMDAMPQSDGHVLVVPKEAAIDLFDLSEESAVAVIRTTKLIANGVRLAFDPDGIAVCQYNGAAAGQTIPHLHFHVVPRYVNIPLREHAREMQSVDVLAEHASRLIRALSNSVGTASD